MNQKSCTFAVEKKNRRVMIDNVRRIAVKALFLSSALVTLSGCQESLEERLAREARELTEKGPQPMNLRGEDGKVYTMICDSIVFDIPTLTQSQYFTLTGELDDGGVVPTREQLLEQLKNEPSYRIHRQKGYSFRYVYRSQKTPGHVFLDLTLKKSDYQ